MDLLRFFRRGRSGDRRGVPPAVEAARRAQRARAHLNSKRESKRGGSRARRDFGDREPGDAADRAIAFPFEAPFEPPSGHPIKPLSGPPAVAPANPVPDSASERKDRIVRAQPSPRSATPLLDSAPQSLPAPSQPPLAAPRPPAPRTSRAKRTPPRAIVQSQPLPRFVVPGVTLLALGAGYAAGQPLFERFWLPKARLERVAVLGAGVREPTRIARALLAETGRPLDGIDEDAVASQLLTDPWIAAARSLRLPDGTLLVGVVERQAVARYQSSPDGEVALIDPEGQPFAGAIEAGGPLPRVEGPVESAEATSVTDSGAAADASLDTPSDDDDAIARAEPAPGTRVALDVAPVLSATALEILGELQRHPELVADPSALTLHLPGSARAIGEPSNADEQTDAAASRRDGEPVAEEAGYVLELGRGGPRALLGRTFLKRRIARLAALLDHAASNPLLASARVIDLRYADRAVLRTEPTSG